MAELLGLRESQGAATARLSNGLRVVTIPMLGVHRIIVDAHVRVGSRFEHREHNGISHFLEHMLYRGTPRHPSAHEQALAFERLGGTLVAATYVDHGSLAIGVPPENFVAVLDLFAEVFQEPLIDAIDIERGIVHEEILEDLDDAGHQVDADNLVRELSFGDHALGFPITGTLEQLERFDRAALIAHHRAFYTASGTVVTIAGPIAAEEALAAVQSRFGQLPLGTAPSSESPVRQNQPRFRYVRHSSSQTALRLAFRAPGEHDPREPSIEMLLRVMDDGMSTRLYHHICDARGLCYDVGAGYEAYADSGLFELAAETAHERAEAVASELAKIVHELAEHGPTADELDKAKARYRWQLDAMLDHPDEMCEFYALGELTGVARTPRERLTQLSSVTAANVRDAAQDIFRPEQMSLVAVGLLSRRSRAALERAALG
jgi:predicted Zn-dependent peptidase